MAHVTSSLTPPKRTTGYHKKWNKKFEKHTKSTGSPASSSCLKTKEQKFGSSKPGKSSKNLPAKNTDGLRMTEDQDHTRVKAPLGMKSLLPRSPPLRLKPSGLPDIADLIVKRYCRKIIVMVGAGISTASGIPDFRTPGSGMYDNLKKYNIPYPEAIFDIDYFTYNPLPFFTLAKELYPGKYKPNVVHYFLRLLHEKGLLLRCYTQNIDGLERMAGIPPEKLVEAHGTFASASCHLCYSPFSAKVARIEPFANIITSLRPNVPRLLINRDLVGPFKKPIEGTDVVELGELCEVVRKFVRALNWQKDMDEVIKSQRQ
ncbi:NAD-dependent protein deacetylase sirtuin-3, mitochondrial-like isoform X2 [Dendrobates tinctorius]|uniref:NAD-dependent protein deacetylase sirtuin-3, mitochondrial-like isoform X2 n=1 Tax=Dendrobates tinctorius TaxID=92724 RepID=UPI003CC94F43